MDSDSNEQQSFIVTSTGEPTEKNKINPVRPAKGKAIQMAAGFEGVGRGAIERGIVEAAFGGAVLNIDGNNIGIDRSDDKQHIVSSGSYISVVHFPKETNSKVIYKDQAVERIDAAVRMNLEQLEQNIAQARKESSQFFKLTLVFSGLGFLVVLDAVALLLCGQKVAGIVSAVASTIPEVTAALFFKKDKELRTTIERYHQHIMESQRILTMIDVAETVQCHEERDLIKRQIICKALGIDSTAINSQASRLFPLQVKQLH